VHPRLEAAVHAVHELPERVGLRAHAPRRLEHRAALVGEHGRALAPIEDRDAEVLLERAHGLAHGRLHALEAPRRRREAPLFGDEEQRAQLVQRVGVVREALGRGGHVHDYHGA
jgi:hypothetical protein